MNYTNEDVAFETVLKQEMQRATALDIAVGFCGLSAVAKYAGALKKIARTGRVRLILGMYRSEGAFSKSLYNALLVLDKELELAASANGRSDGTGVYVTHVDYHGKLWRFQQGSESTLWIGSNNFSDAGIKDRLEACVNAESQDAAALTKFIDKLASQGLSSRISQFGFTSSPSTAKLDAIVPLNALPAGVQVVGTMEIRLRPAKQPCSSLNLSRGKGRVSKGIYTPRPWYEVELTAAKHERDNPLYPKPPVTKKDGKGRHDNKFPFKAYLSDGSRYWPIELSTYSDHNKAMASTPRSILGEFLKSRLEANTSLRRGDTITEDILSEYGRDSVTLSKLSNGEYVLTF